MDWIGLLITACYVIAAGAGLDLALSATHSHSEKKEFARILNERFLRSHGDTTVPVFKVFFGTLESILLRLLGPRLISSRLVIMVAAYSAVFFCAYVLFVILTGRLNITIVHRVFETRHGILTFFVLGAFSLLTNIILMAHTRLFTLFLRTYPTGLTFILLAYSDIIVKMTLFAIVFSLGILFSVLAIDVTMKKDIPVAVYWLPLQGYPDNKQTTTDNFAIKWPEVIDPPGYSDYRLSPREIELHTRSVTVADAENADDVIEKQLNKMNGIEFERLTEEENWPVDCVDTSCDLYYTHIAHVLPFYGYGIRDVGLLWVYGIVQSFTTALVGVTSIGEQLVFFDPNELYNWTCEALSGETFGKLLGDLVTTTNPRVDVVVPLTPFFVSGIFLSIIIYVSAVCLKFLTVVLQVSHMLIKTKWLYVSETVPFTQGAAIVAPLFLLYPLLSVV